MIQLSYEDIINKIQSATSLPREEIETKVNTKLAELEDLISKEGAAHIVANNLGVKLFDTQPKTLKIQDIVPGQTAIIVTGKVIALYGTREFQRRSTQGGKGKVASLQIGDSTGAIRAVIWDENLIAQLANVKEGDIIKFRNAYSRENNNGFKELHVGARSQLVINPEGETIDNVQIKIPSTRKKIAELTGGEFVEIAGTVVQLFEPRFYPACPECNKKVVAQENGSWFCIDHGEIVPKQIPIANIFFDDSSGVVIRAVAFRDHAQKLMQASDSELQQAQTEPSFFQKLKTKVTGQQLILQGKVVKNDIADRLEFIINSVQTIAPEELIQQLKEK